MKRVEKKYFIGYVNYDESSKPENRVYIEMALYLKNPDKPGLAISGEIWQKDRRDILSGGQNLDTINEMKNDFVFNRVLFEKLYGWWEKWHLNDMNAGTPEQMEFLRNYKEENNLRGLDYNRSVEILKENGIYEIEWEGKPYRYGYGWIYKEIDADVLQEICMMLDVNLEQLKAA